MLNPNQLRIFVVAAEALNFSKAAQTLNLSQPSITQHIQLLEAQFGKPLFDRTGRKLKLTETGSALLPLVRQLVETTIDTENQIDAILEGIHGNLIIGCSTSPGRYLLPLVLADFMGQYPAVKAICQITSREIALQRLNRGEVDFALSSSLLDIPSEIEVAKLFSDPVDLIVPSAHRFAKMKVLQPQELLDERFIMREECSGTYQVVKTGMAASGINIANLQIFLTLGSSEAIAVAVASGIGIGFISHITYQFANRDGIESVKVQGLERGQDIYICRNRLTRQTRAQSLFWEYISKVETGVSKYLK
ncbi:MAG: LysR family transcriptional regulator [Anaerolineae bacterium]|nr:LysR family transcriptional regulator [Anaerolineae bacterium]